VVVHDLEQARHAVAAAADLGVAVDLRSAPDAAAYAGVGFLHAIGEALGRPLIVDCGADAGLVMAALRTGCRTLAYAGPHETFERLAEMADQVGAALRHEPAPPEVLPLDPEDEPGLALRRHLLIDEPPEHAP
jgi:hypothetical protein